MEKYEIEHIQRLRKIAPECMVLLKKDGSFPLASAGKIALFGSGARHTIKGGTGSGDVNVRHYVTVEEGLKNSGFEITTESWLNSYDKVLVDAHKKFIADIKAEAKKQHTLAIMLAMGKVQEEPEYSIPVEGDGDTAIYVLARNSGEGNDRTVSAGDIKLTKTEIRDILACNLLYKNFMLVLNVGGVVDLAPVMEVKNILILSQLGSVTGDALADVLLGKAYPSGKLTTTWAKAEDIEASCDFGDPDDTEYREGIYVGYRYYDSLKIEPNFPFGYGLSYTDFEISEPIVNLDGRKVKLSAKVKNTGNYKGKEILEVYVTSPWGKLDNPYQKLAAFVKTPELSPNERAEISVSFAMDELAVFDTETSSLILEEGKYIVRFGTSSKNTKPVAVINLNETVTIREVSHIGGDADIKDFVPEQFWKNEDISLVPQFEMNKDAFEALTFPEKAEINPATKLYINSLSNEELAHMVVGAGHAGKSPLSVIGSASKRVAGAAGENYSLDAKVKTIKTPDGPTAVRLSKVKTMVMSDGPAGLRLSTQFTRDKNGNVASGGSMLPADMVEFMPPLVGKLMGGNKKLKGKVYEQYCTAIPIGTALAQSYNKAVCMECGDIVGEEMERFNVDLWLAPAFNIHRSPLCGRNFEYCSEDPVVSGFIGASITNGVQKHKNKGVTIKHFCVNNQETNRYQSNSVVSERALRELYLKGFELCIKASQPAALMTSYNLLNGVHTSEHADLLKTFLRDEVGFTGLVMSDWIISMIENKKSRYRMEIASASIKGGNDIFMPGTQGDYKDILSALNGKNSKCTLTREELEYCASHVFEASEKYGK